jgi:hypothetical protein
MPCESVASTVASEAHPCPFTSYSSIFARVLPADWQLTADRAKRHLASQASQIFQLLTYSKRPMKNYEIRDAVTMCMEGVSFIDNENRVQDPIFNHCKPLVEPASDDTVRFIHVSVKEYVAEDCHTSARPDNRVATS